MLIDGAIASGICGKGNKADVSLFIVISFSHCNYNDENFQKARAAMGIGANGRAVCYCSFSECFQLNGADHRRDFSFNFDDLSPVFISIASRDGPIHHLISVRSNGQRISNDENHINYSKIFGIE